MNSRYGDESFGTTKQRGFAQSFFTHDTRVRASKGIRERVEVRFAGVAA